MKKQRLLFIFFSAVLLLCCSVALSWAFTLPDTGQTKCYNTAGTSSTEISCTGSGQDGAYDINPMSFTDNGNGTITDNVTGLMWQKEDDNTTRNWAAAGTYCDSLTLGGQSDWRLPTKKELMSVVDYSIPYPGPAINTTYFPTHMRTTTGCLLRMLTVRASRGTWASAVAMSTATVSPTSIMSGAYVADSLPQRLLRTMAMAR